MASFTRISLNNAYTHSRSDAAPWEDLAGKAIAVLPGGSQKFWGVPFDLGSDDGGMGLIVVGAEGSEDAVDLSVEGTATHLVFAHVCDSRARTTVAGQSTDYPLTRP